MPEKPPHKEKKQLPQHEHSDYEHMLMHAPIGVFSSTPDGRLLYVNSTMARLFGYDSPQEMKDSESDVGSRFYADPGDREKMRRFLEEHDEILDIEHCFIRRDGSRFWASCNVRAVRNDAGAIDHYQGFVSDITERKQEKESLLRTQFAMDRAPDSILWVDDEGHIVYANESACASVEYEREELLNMKVFDIDPDLPPDQWERHKEEVRRQGTMTFESRHRTKDGRLFPVEVRSNHFFYKDRYLACAFDRDITERKGAEKALRESEEKYRGLVEGLNEALYRMTFPDGVYEYVSPAAMDVLGYSAEEIQANPLLIRKAIHPDFREFLEDALEKLAIGEVPPTVEFKIIDSYGKERWILQSNKGIFNEQGKVIALEGLCRDITKRRRDEEELRESEGILKSLFAATPVGVALLKDRVFRKVNHALCRITGYSEEEMLGMMTRILYPDDEEFYRIGEQLYEQMKREGLGVKEAVLKGKDGRLIDVVLSLSPTNPGDPSAGVCVTVQDITERKRAEEALRASEAKFRALHQSMNDAFVSVNMEGRIQDYNETFLSMLGYAPEEIGTLTYKDITPGKWHETEQVIVEKQVLSKGFSEVYEKEYLRKDGTVFPVELRTTLLRDAKGDPVSMWAIVRDVTERKRAEEALRESEEKYRFLTESMTDVVWTTDMNLKITYVSPSIVHMLGFTPGERMLQNVEDTMTRDSYETAVSLLARELENERSGTADPDRFLLIQTEYYHKEGHTVWVESVVRFIRDRDGHPAGIHGLSRDVTERKRAEQEREKWKEQLNRSQKLESIGTLAGGIAHDFNNLLMGIQGNASLMMFDLDPSDPLCERLKHIEEQVRSGADLTNQLLGFAQGGRYELKPTDLNEIVENTASMFGRTRKEITIHRKYERGLRPVEADRTQMGQVFMNLFLNASQAMPGGGEIYLETENILVDDAKGLPLALSPGKYVRIAISDTGSGMDAKTLERIFDPFFTTKEMGRGTGLGLATVYGIVKGHGGAIDVDSKPGLGTTFRIYLPATDKAIAGKMPAEAKVLRGTETLLLVDDENMVLDVTRSMLQSLGYRVFCASNGREAMEIYRGKKDEIDLVILDMIMPGVSGSETFDGLRKINPKQKVLLSSGYSIHGEAKELLERGCSGFLQKPFQLKDLAREVRTILDAQDSPS